MGRQLNKYYRSFSGTDALVFAIMPNSSPVVLGSLSTVSYSMYRDKKPVPVIGQINVGGFTRGTRIYAGTMIFTMINQHWLNELTENLPWIKHSGVDKVDELPLFDLMIVCANEYGATMQMMIYGVDLTEEGQVLSVENLFTENTFSFVARDIENFTNELMKKGVKSSSSYSTTASRTRFTYSLPEPILEDDVLKQYHAFFSSRMVESDEVRDIQERLNRIHQAGPSHLLLDVTGRYDEPTCEAVLRFQSRIGLAMTGEMNDDTYKQLKCISDSPEAIKQLKVIPVAKVISEQGAIAKASPSHLAHPVYRYNFNEDIHILSITPDGHWLQTEKGFVPAYQTIHHQQRSRYVFQTIDASCQNQVLIGEIQRQLREYGRAKGVKETGQFDAQMQHFIHRFQVSQGLTVSRVLDEPTWYALKSEGYLTLADEYVFEKKTHVTLHCAPNVYTTSLETLQQNLTSYGMTYEATRERLTAKLSLFVHHTNGEKTTAYQEIVIEPFQETHLTLARFTPELQSIIGGVAPLQRIELVAYLVHDVPYKWSIQLKEEVK